MVIITTVGHHHPRFDHRPCFDHDPHPHQQVQPVKMGLQDQHPYVRRTAVLGVLKMHHLDEQVVAEQGMPLCTMTWVLLTVLTHTVHDDLGASHSAHTLPHTLKLSHIHTRWFCAPQACSTQSKQ